MSSKPTTSMKRRLNIFIALVLIAFCGWVVYNLVTVSLVHSEDYQELANKQQFRTRTINANRGTIYDANGQILAKSATVYTVFVDATSLKKNDEDKRQLIIDTLSEILEVDKETVAKRANQDSGYEIIKRKVEKDVADKVIEFKSSEGLSSIGCDPDSKRYYPQNDLASAVIGFTGFEGNGQYGLEAEYDEYLSGIDGRIISAKDANGADMPYRYEQSFEAQDGNSLILNIDATLQFYLERELNNCIDSNDPNERACGIIMNPKTGQILAMSSKPDFDLNNPTEITDLDILEVLNQYEEGSEEYTKERALAWERQWKNKAISELYFPGSVFKVITGSSALEEKAISLTDTFTCTGVIDVLGTKFHCWSHVPHGPQNFVEAMTNSCNPAFVQIGQKLGIEKFCEYFKSYGLDTITGIDLPGEVTSLYVDSDNMTLVDLAPSSFGQTNKITPIEMITAYAAVVNGGQLVTPYVVDKIVDSNGNIVKQFEPQVKRQVISEETSKIMRETLESVVETNGGSNAYIQGYKIGGKSGTSQKLDIPGGKEIYVGSYCAFAPADDPEIIMLVMVDEPTGDYYYGSKVAAPVVRNVLNDALPYLGYLPEFSEEEYERMPIAIPDVTDKDYLNADSTLQALSLKVEKVGEGDTVVKQVPEAGQEMPRDGKVILYTQEQPSEFVTVPDVTNMSLEEANQTLTNAGLNFMPTGGAAYHAGSFAVSQSYNGAKVERGTIVEVEFLYNEETG